MKKFLSWLPLIGGAALFVLFDIWLIRTLFHRPAQQRGGTGQAMMTAAELDALNLGDALPPDVKPQDVPIVRPKWIKLPPAQLVTLRNSVMTVSITRPDDPGSYKDARFDWSGFIARVDYNGHYFFNGPDALLDDKTNYPVFGTAEEFGPEGPLGFADAKVGQTFVKIGVGELKKPDKPSWYWWAIPYEIVRPGSWKVTTGESWIQYEQELSGPRGIGYRYLKRVELEADKPVVRIARTLANIGSAPIRQTHYGHNFVTIDGQRVVGPPWQVDFNYTVTPHPNPRYWRLRDILRPQEKSMVFAQPLSSGAVFVLMTAQPRGAEDHVFRVSNPAAGASVTIRGDRPLTRIALYCNSPVVCPEPFVQLNIEPGAQDAWQTTYTFEADPTRAAATEPTIKSWQDRLRERLSQPKPTEPAAQ